MSSAELSVQTLAVSAPSGDSSSRAMLSSSSAALDLRLFRFASSGAFQPMSTLNITDLPSRPSCCESEEEGPWRAEAARCCAAVGSREVRVPGIGRHAALHTPSSSSSANKMCFPRLLRAFRRPFFDAGATTPASRRTSSSSSSSSSVPSPSADVDCNKFASWLSCAFRLSIFWRQEDR